MNILEIDGLTKCYGHHIALDNVSLNIKRGTIFGLLGPNGAGKTTLLRIINSILVSDSGIVKVNGIPVSVGTTSPKIGYLPEERGLYPKMRVEDQIMYYGLLKGMDKNRLRDNMLFYLEMFNLGADRYRKIEELSKGNQQKVQIISTVVYNPELIILDEPFSGFDPINGSLLTELIEKLSNSDATIILSSHNMNAIENICDNIAILNKGKLLISGDLADIKQSHKTGIIDITVEHSLSIPMLYDSGLISNVNTIDVDKFRQGYRYNILPNQGISNNMVIREISMQSEIIKFEEKLPSLEELFLQYTSNKN